MAHQKVVNSSADDAVGEFDELQPGTKLLNGQYTITCFLNNGGFGITYLAKDSLNRTVVIKECFLSSMCRRSKTVVVARSRAHQAELRSVVQLFIREAHNLAKLVHPNIVAVHQVFEDKGTAYMAIDYIDGADLLELVEEGAAKFAPDEIVRITEKLLSAVKFIHDNGMLHRDISPDNILINKNGDPMLIDFGAAREQVTRKSRALTALRVVKDGYSPQEFYIAGSAQGPWSDLYALGATLYHVISGQAPANGQARLAEIAEGKPDSYVPLAGRFGGYPKGFLEAIDKAMNSVPKNRLQSAPEWLAEFRNPDVLQIYPERHAAQSGQAGLASVVMVADAVSAAEIIKPIEAPVSKATVGKAGRLMAAGFAAAMVFAGLTLMYSYKTGGEASQPIATSADAPVEVASAAPKATMDVPKPAIEPVAPVVDAVAAVPEEAAPAVAAPKVKAQDAVEAKPIEAAPAVVPPADVAANPMPEVAAAVEQPEVAQSDVKAALPAAEVPVADQQISLAAWDVQLPFAEINRVVGGKQIIVISRVAPGVDLAVAGSWIRPGLTISAVNEQPIQPGATLAGMVLGALKVDPDGYTRVSVRYTDEAGVSQTGLLASPAVRVVNLVNGVSLRVQIVERQWQTSVQSVADGSATTLVAGDVLFREKTTGTALVDAEALEAAIATLVANKVGTAEFSVIRGSSLLTAFMQLAIK